MDSDKIGCGLVSLFGIIIVFFLIISLTGLHVQTGEGQHVGYVTATSTNGLIFKTSTAYIKTDTQSSQEDAYCVTDKAILAELKRLSDVHAHVQVDFIDYISNGVATCGDGSEIITGVTEIK